MELRKTFHIRRDGLQIEATVVRDVAGRIRLESPAGVFEDARVLDGGRTISLRHQGRMYLVAIARLGPRLRGAQLNGRLEHVEVLDELAAAEIAGRHEHEAVAELRAEMPGLVVEVKVAPGQAVQRGEALVVLEAMKMQNELTAPRAGIVDEVMVQAGQKVDGGALLLRLSDAEAPADASGTSGGTP